MKKTYCHVINGYVESVVISDRPVTKMEGYSMVEMKGEEREAAGKIYVTADATFYMPAMVEVVNENGASTMQKLFDAEKGRIEKSEEKKTFQSKIGKVDLSDEELVKLKSKLKDISPEKVEELENTVINLKEENVKDGTI